MPRVTTGIIATVSQSMKRLQRADLGIREAKKILASSASVLTSSGYHFCGLEEHLSQLSGSQTNPTGSLNQHQKITGYRSSNYFIS